MSESNNKNLKGNSDEKFSSEDGFVDIDILCLDCGEEFLWAVGEQLFFQKKGLKNQPKRCKVCKKAKNQRLSFITNSDEIRKKTEVRVICAGCSRKTTIPFYPSQGRPVFCKSCFLSMKPRDKMP